ANARARGDVLSGDEGFATFTQDRSIPMTDEAMSPLRRRMIEDMTIRKLAPKTQQGYIRAIKDFAAFLGPIARHGELRGRPTLSAASGGERRAHPDSQSRRGSVAVLLQGYAEALRHHRAHDVHPRARQAAGRAQPGGSGAPAGCSTRAQIQ